MIVEPYKQTPHAPRVALLTPGGEAISEHGERLDLDDWPADHRLFASYDTVYTLVREGRGEALCWNREEIRWRHRRFELDWRRRKSDANVLKLPLGEQHELTLRALARWRDWLAGWGASPTGTTGSAAWSLLRARLQRKLVTGTGMRPPLLQTLGGRQLLGPAGRGRFTGKITQADLPAAYAAELGGIFYGGIWIDGSMLPHKPDWYVDRGQPVFARAQVVIPADLGYGPLPRRPRKRMSYLQSALLGADYPRGRRLQGVWTWQELQTAEDYGCRVIRILNTWVHRSGWQPFADWWRVVESGREMGGMAGLLAKMTGNALWGRFAMDPRAAGLRTIRSREGSKLVNRKLRQNPFQWPAHDLAETVSGRVRARLFEAIMEAGERLLSAHTDGVWLHGTLDLDGWREKQRARQLDLLDPQVLRYWPRRSRTGEPWVVFAGVPAERAAAAFEQAWREEKIA